MKQFYEYLWGLCYNLRMMGIPCNGLAYDFFEKESALCNTSIPESKMNKIPKLSCTVYFVRVNEGMNGRRCMSTHTILNQIYQQSDFLTEIR